MSVTVIGNKLQVEVLADESTKKQLNDIQQEVKDLEERLEERVDTIIAGTVDGVSGAEIVDARQGEVTLGTNITRVKSQLSDMSTKIDLTESELVKKADKSYADNQLLLKRDKSEKIKGTELDTSSNEFKIKPINVSDELMEMFSPSGSVSPVIPDGSIGTTKYADSSITWSKLGNMQPFIYPYPLNNLYIELDIPNDKVYFKANAIYVRNPQSLTSNWETIKAMGTLSTRVNTSPKGTEDCIELDSGESFVYNTVTNVFEVAAWNEVTPQQIKLLQITNGEITGPFAYRYNLTQVEGAIKELDEQVSLKLNTSDMWGYNFAMPDLEGKEYLGDGVYSINEYSNAYNRYDITTGNFINYKMGSQHISADNNKLVKMYLETGEYSISFIDFEGSFSGGLFSYIYKAGSVTDYTTIFNGKTNLNDVHLVVTIEESGYYDIGFSMAGSVTEMELTFKLQLEKGDTATSYTLPGQVPQTGIPDSSITWSKFGNMQPFIYPYPLNSLYIEIDKASNEVNDKVYFKVSQINVRNPQSLSSQWAQIKAMGTLSTRVNTSPKGTEDCIELDSGESFVYNTVTNVFEVAAWNEVTPQQIKLLQLSNGEVTGQFGDRYNLAQVEGRVPESLMAFIYPFPLDSLYEEKSGTTFYIKMTNLYIRDFITRSYSWNQIKSTLASNIKVSPSGVVDCLELLDGDLFVYTISKNSLEVLPWGSLTTDHIVLLRTNNGEITGALQNRYNFKSLNDKIEQGITPIPEHWVSYLDTKIAEIKSKQSEFGRNGFSFGFITDMHWPSNNKNSAKLLAKIMNECDIKYFINGGDSTNQSATRQGAIDQHRQVMSEFRKNGILNKGLFCLGNHDDNTQAASGNISVDITLNPDMMYEECFRQVEQVKNINVSENGLYHYADDVTQKVRYIALNSVDANFTVDENDMVTESAYMTPAYRQEQIDWLIDALDLPENDWSVIFASHVPPTKDDWTAKNRDIIIGIVNAFKTKTTYSKTNTFPNTVYNASVNVDFTNKPGEVICWVSGHMHEDFIDPLDSGINVVVTVNDAYDRLYGTAVTKVRGTTTEQAFDILTVNKSTRTVYITRIGAGSDRIITY